MALQTSGAISLNDIHIEAGGTTGTQASINDADIRDLIDKASGAQSSFSGFYGATSTVEQVLWTTTLTAETFGGFLGYRFPYELYMQGYGTLSDNTCDFIDDSQGNPADVMILRGNTDNDYFGFTLRNVSTQVIFNEGFDRVVIRAPNNSEVSLNRTDAVFSFNDYYVFSTWYWSDLTTGPLTAGEANYTVRFVNDVPA